MISWYDYPEMHQCDAIVWSPEPDSAPSLCVAGEVAVVKTQSLDARVFFPDGVITKHDLWHADDPNVKLDPLYRQPGRGVFRLAHREIVNRQRDMKLVELERKVDELQWQLADMRRQLAVPARTTEIPPAALKPVRKTEFATTVK